MRRIPLRRELLLAVALASFLAAALLGALAVDVGRWRTTLREDDVRYRVASQEVRWRPSTVAPGAAGGKLVGVEDDVAFRRALTAVRGSELTNLVVSDPKLALRRTEASQRLESIVVHDRDRTRRSRAANFLGVLSMVAFSTTPTGGDSADRSELILNAIASFEQAIAIDPGNAEAKYNLQVMLLRGQGLLPTEAAAGRNPLPGGRGARGAGAGEPGSGY